MDSSQVLSDRAKPEPGEAAGFAPGEPAFSVNDIAATLRRRAAGSDAGGLLRLAFDTLVAGRVVAVSSFGAESAVCLALIAEIAPATPVIFLDTAKHFPETLAYRDRLVELLGLSDVRSVAPDPEAVAAVDPAGDLWQRRPDQCCLLRKVLPLEGALSGFHAWINGRKRYHGGARAGLERIEVVEGRVKINPLADWSGAEIAAAFARRNLPRHPLVARGYASIGCAPCTRPTGAAGARSGRWSGSTRTECGIHIAAAHGLKGGIDTG